MSEPINSEKKLSFKLGLGIFFFPYIFSWFTLKPGYSRASKIVAFGWLAMVLISFAAGKPPGNNTTSQYQASSRAPSKEEPINESCETLSAYFDAESNLSDLQKEELFKKYKGKKFEWDLRVTDVRSATFGSGYTVQFKCKNSRSFIQDVVIDFDKDAKSFAMSLQKNKVYQIKGQLSRQSTLLGLSAEAVD